MHLAYLDDSGTRDKKSPFQVVTAVIVEDKRFAEMEFIHGAAVEAIVPKEKLDVFEEFHAWELYGGYGVFEGVPQPLRFNVIKALLEVLTLSKIPIVYGAVDKLKLEKLVYGSANPVDVCFRTCMQGVHKWVRQPQFPGNDLALLIVDDYEDKELKKTLRRSFRQLRTNAREPEYTLQAIWHLHDEMYFGNSKDSIGIQIADLCGYFISKHLRGSDPAAEGFYEIIKDRIFHSKVEPE